jgi:hypothetical protein
MDAWPSLRWSSCLHSHFSSTGLRRRGPSSTATAIHRCMENTMHTRSNYRSIIQIYHILRGEMRSSSGLAIMSHVRIRGITYRLNSELTFSRFWLGKCHAGAGCECAFSICDKTGVSRCLGCLGLILIDQAVSCSTTTLGTGMVLNTHFTTINSYQHGYLYLP